MHSARLAEWILSLFTHPDRASSIVGDLAEEAPARGNLWFWWSVLRIACAHLLRDVFSSPVMSVAGWGCAIGILLSTAVGLIAGAVWMKVMGAPYPLGHSSMGTVMAWWISFAKVVNSVAVPFLVGWLVARSSRRSEVAAVSATLAISLALCWPVILVYGPISYPLPLIGYVQTPMMIAGAVLFRHRANTHVRTI